MNKQEAINELMSKCREIIFGDDENVYLSRKRTIEPVSQINEPQKVVVPKFVAEWLKECKRSGWHLRKVLSRLDDDEKIGDWAYDENDDLISEKVDMIARAWLDGFEIEKEKLYTVEIPDPHGMYKIRYLFRYLFRNRMGNIRIGGSDYKDIFLDVETHLTEAEIKKDFEWAWDAGFAKPVEE